MKSILCLIGKGVEAAEADGAVVLATASLTCAPVGRRSGIVCITQGQALAPRPMSRGGWYPRTFLGTEFTVSVGSPGSHPMSPSPHWGCVVTEGPIPALSIAQACASLMGASGISKVFSRRVFAV